MAPAFRRKNDSEDLVKNVLLALVIGASISVPLQAELKYTQHMEVKKTDAPPQPVNPMIGIMGDAVMKQMVPDGSADIVYLVGPKGARMEFQQSAMGLPAGTINLMMMDGTVVIMNPKEKTYSKTSVQATLDAMKAAGVAIPEVAVKRTGQF